MGLKVVLRSYGGDNDKGRPPFYTKDLVVASFLRAAAEARESAATPDEVEVFFVNDGPIPAQRLRVMEERGHRPADPGRPGRDAPQLRLRPRPARSARLVTR